MEALCQVTASSRHLGFQNGRHTEQVSLNILKTKREKKFISVAMSLFCGFPNIF